jgi:DNA helicase-2/ATP-dependent DNA helicase PcrA
MKTAWLDDDSLGKRIGISSCFVVGMEEDLFPSAMSMSTRSELEEESFLCGVTRAGIRRI